MTIEPSRSTMPPVVPLPVRGYISEVLEQEEGFGSRVEIGEPVLVSTETTGIIDPKNVVSLLRLHSHGIWRLGVPDPESPVTDRDITFEEIQETSLLLGARVVSLYEWGSENIVVWSVDLPSGERLTVVSTESEAE